jgi:uncharacterized protein YciI
MNHYILKYQLHKDYLNKRELFRQEHFNLVKAYKESGELLMGGATEDHTEAFIIFKCRSKTRVEEFVDNDPYIISGTVTEWQIKAWNMVTADI